MIFTEPAFLFVFLPLALLVNFVGGHRFRNLFLLGLSLLFYFMGERGFVLLMIMSCGMNYGLGRWVDRQRGLPAGRRVLALSVALNLSLLGVFKYASFLVESINPVLAPLGWSLPPLDIHLPIGISFFTFQALSYLVDVYRGKIPVERKWSDLALYISLFPQLIAGPIVRYGDLVRELHHRSIRLGPFVAGVERFILGLAKKTIIANTLAVTADGIFALAPEQLSTPLAWIGLLAYAFQIYYDFSGYSDMAIGIGMMLGFRFPENFNYPYISRSMSEFWRRWHISLSTWFRDYLYIPLGGNRKGGPRTAFNLLLVFFLCGLWHGASWNFVIWGLFHGAFLMLERVGVFHRFLSRYAPLGLVYTWVVVLFSWVFFRCETLASSLSFFHVLLLPGKGSGIQPGLYLDALSLTVFCVALIFATPVYPLLRSRLQTSRAIAVQGVYVVVLLAVFLLSLSQIAANTYNPFIYFRF